MKKWLLVEILNTRSGIYTTVCKDKEAAILTAKEKIKNWTESEKKNTNNKILVGLLDVESAVEKAVEEGYFSTFEEAREHIEKTDDYVDLDLLTDIEIIEEA